MNGIGSKLRLLMEQCNIKQNRFAKEMGISPSRLSNYLTDKRKPDLESLAKMAKHLGADLNFFSDIEFNKLQKDSSVDAENVKIPFIHKGKKKPNSFEYIKLNKLFIPEYSSSTEDLAIIKLNKSNELFKRGTFLIIDKLSNKYENNSVVIESDSLSLYHYINYDNANLLVSINDKKTTKITNNEMEKYFIVVKALLKVSNKINNKEQEDYNINEN